MKDAYNVALNYLRNKYNLFVLHDNVPDTVKADHNDHSVYLLVTQYYYGLSAKKDLEYKLTSMKIDFEKRYT